MTTHHPIFGPARLRVSRIVYNCDISRADGRSIPLGVIADVRANHWYGLALSARKGVFDDELSCVGERARRFVANPFEWLKTEFDRVFNAENPDDAFAQLCNVHATSLMVSRMDPVELPIPKSIASSELDVQRGFLEDQVNTLVKTAYWDLIGASEHPGLPKSLADLEYSDAA